MEWDKGVNWNNEKFIYTCKNIFLSTNYLLFKIILINFSFLVVILCYYTIICFWQIQAYKNQYDQLI